MTPSPDSDDVVVRFERGNPTAAYLLGTSLAPDQFMVHTRDQAVSQAVAYARHQRVRAWFAVDDGFVLLGTFRAEPLERARRTTLSRA